jgi:hypothetical protein
MRRIRGHMTYANVMATLAVFLVLGGGAYAAFHLPRNSVRSRNIVNGQVKQQDLAKPPPFKSAGLKGNTVVGVCTSTPHQWASLDAYGRVGYYRDLDGIVHLTGIAMYCNPPSNVIFRLPAGYRPPGGIQLQVSGDSQGQLRSIALDGKTGNVTVSGLSKGNSEFLDGVSFRCGPLGKYGCP